MSDDGEWTPEMCYKRVKRAILGMQAKENPTDSLCVCEDQQLRMSLCANGPLSASQYERAVEMLHTNGEIAFGETYLSYPCNVGMSRDAIAYVVEQDDVDQAFIGRMNQLQQELKDND